MPALDGVRKEGVEVGGQSFQREMKSLTKDEMESI